jgi:hypothetical protein
MASKMGVAVLERPPIEGVWGQQQVQQNDP